MALASQILASDKQITGLGNQIMVLDRQVEVLGRIQTQGLARIMGSINSLQVSTSSHQDLGNQIMVLHNHQGSASLVSLRDSVNLRGSASQT